MNTTNKLIGKKIKGFKFDETNETSYNPKMDIHIGEIGQILEYKPKTNAYSVEFKLDTWNYPAELIEQHLVEETPLDDLPIIGDGVFMEVSDDGDKWVIKNIFAKYMNRFVAWADTDFTLTIQLCKYARPITPKTKITRKEFEQKFEIID
jgi:hypothetical protein